MYSRCICRVNFCMFSGVNNKGCNQPLRVVGIFNNKTKVLFYKGIP